MKSDKKKLLILAYDFPPYTSVGRLRPYSWYQHLNQYDISPIIITRQWNNKFGNELDYIAPSEFNKTIIEETEKGVIYKTAYKPNLSNRILLKHGQNKYWFVRKALSVFYEFAQFLLIVGPKSNLFVEAENYLKSNQVDAIIATGEPFVLFKYASKLSRRYNTPWFADYRDPWTQNQLRSPNKFMAIWNGFMEKKQLKNCKHIITVSAYCKSLIAQTNPHLPISIIPNGFDNYNKQKVSAINQNNKTLSIGFAGSIYNWHPIELVFDTLLQHNVVLNFYGISNPDEIKLLISKKYPALEERVNIYPKQSQDVLVEKLSTNNLLLLFNDYNIIGSKIYTYLIANRHILFCFKADENSNELKIKHYPYSSINNASDQLQEKVILNTHSGTVLQDQNHLSKVLSSLQKEFEEHRFIKCNTNNIDKYSRMHIPLKVTTQNRFKVTT